MEELSQQLRHLQTTSAATISNLQSQLRAEKEKYATLENAVREKSETSLLTAKLSEAVESEKELRQEIDQLKRKAEAAGDMEDAQSRLNALETENFLLNQKLHQIEKQLKETRNEAVRTKLAPKRQGKTANNRGFAGEMRSLRSGISIWKRGKGDKYAIRPCQC